MTYAGRMMNREHQRLTKTPEDARISIEEMERRLEMQILEGGLTEADLCFWYACTDVCPPGG
jgi:hypothetical protein